MEIGLKIKNLRANKNITQEELAKVLKISTQAVSKWENGGSPDLELIPDIAKYFNVSTDYLFGIETNNYSDVEEKLVKYISSLERSKKYNEIFKLCYYMSVGGHDYDDIENMSKATGDLAKMVGKYGVYFGKLKEDSKFFAILPKPESGNYNVLLKNKEIHIELCRELGYKDFYEAIVLLHSRPKGNFTEQLFVKELGVSEDRAKELIDSLLKFRFLNKSELEIDDQKKVIYSPEHNAEILGVFAFLDLMSMRSRSYSYYCTEGDFNLFEKENKQ